MIIMVAEYDRDNASGPPYLLDTNTLPTGKFRDAVMSAIDDPANSCSFHEGYSGPIIELPYEGPIEASITVYIE